MRCVDSRSDFLELPEKNWQERHFICFGFVSYRRCFLHSQPPFLCSRAFRLFGNGNECDGCLSVHYNFLFISLLLQQRDIGTSVLLI